MLFKTILNNDLNPEKNVVAYTEEKRIRIIPVNKYTQ